MIPARTHICVYETNHFAMQQARTLLRTMRLKHSFILSRDFFFVLGSSWNNSILALSTIYTASSIVTYSFGPHKHPMWEKSLPFCSTTSAPHFSGLQIAAAKSFLKRHYNTQCYLRLEMIVNTHGSEWIRTSLGTCMTCSRETVQEKRSRRTLNGEATRSSATHPAFRRLWPLWEHRLDEITLVCSLFETQLLWTCPCPQHRPSWRYVIPCRCTICSSIHNLIQIIRCMVDFGSICIAHDTLGESTLDWV